MNASGMLTYQAIVKENWRHWRHWREDASEKLGRKLKLKVRTKTPRKPWNAGFGQIGPTFFASSFFPLSFLSVPEARA